MDLDFADLLMEVISRRASDLHVTAGAAPSVRVRGRLTPVDGYPKLTPSDTREIIYSILTNDQRQRLETDWQLDFAYSIPGRGALPRQRLLPALGAWAPPSASSRPRSSRSTTSGCRPPSTSSRRSPAASSS